MDPATRQQEKVVVDESALDLDGTSSPDYYAAAGKQGTNFDEQDQDEYLNNSLNQSQRSANRSRREPTSARQNKNQSAVDVSMDHEYLGKIDIMEQQNRDYQKEIEKLKLARDGEK